MLLQLFTASCLLFGSSFAEDVKKYYGEDFVFDIPERAELLEFTPLNPVDQPKVLWNRTNPDDGGRVNVTSDGAKIAALTPADNGRYDLKQKDNTVIWEKRLTVEGIFEDYYRYEKSMVVIILPVASSTWTVTFKPKSGSEKEVLVRDGHVVTEGGTYQESFDMRLSLTSNGLEIYDLQIGDSGVFEVTDKNGHLALTARLAVDNEPAHPLIYVGAAVGSIAFFLILGWCLKKTFCKNGCCKKDKSQAAVHYKNQSCGQTAPVQADSDQPANPNTSKETATTSAGPSGF